MNQPKPNFLIKLGYFMLAFNLVSAFINYSRHNREYALMCMFVGVLWIVMLLIWTRTENDEEEK